MFLKNKIIIKIVIFKLRLKNKMNFYNKNYNSSAKIILMYKKFI